MDNRTHVSERSLVGVVREGPVEFGQFRSGGQRRPWTTHGGCSTTGRGFHEATTPCALFVEPLLGLFVPNSFTLFTRQFYLKKHHWDYERIHNDALNKFLLNRSYVQIRGKREFQAIGQLAVKKSLLRSRAAVESRRLVATSSREFIPRAYALQTLPRVSLQLPSNTSYDAINKLAPEYKLS